MRVNDTGAGLVAATAAAHGAQRPLPLQRLRLRRRPRARRTSSPTCRRAISAYGRSKQAGETSVATANPRHFIVRSSWLFGTRRPELRRDDAAGRRRAAGGDRRLRPGRLPDLHAAPRRGAGAARSRATSSASTTSPPRGRCSWFEFAQEIFDQAGRRLPGDGRDDRDARPPGAAAAATRCSAPSAPTRSRCPDWHAGPAPTYLGGSASARVACDEPPGHRRRRLHRLGLRPPPARDPSRRLGAGPRQAHLRGPAREPRGRSTQRRRRARQRPTSPTPRPSPRDRRAATRSSTSPPSPTSTARSRPRASSSRPTSSAPSCCSRRRARPGIRHLQISTDEVYGSIDEGSFTESSPIDPSSPYSASKAGGDMMVGAYRNTYGAEALIVRASNNYGPAPVPREADPAAASSTRSPATRCRSTATACRSATGSASRTSRAAIDIVLEFGEAGRGLQRRRPRRAAQHRGRQADPRAHRPRRVADRLRRRPPRPRPPLLALLRRRPRGSAGRPRSASTTGIERTVEWYRDNEWWWEPIRSGEYREYYERQYGAALALMADTRLDRPELDGLVLLEPRVHGDERGFLVETFSADALARARRRRRRSSRTTTRARPRGILRGLHFQTDPGRRSSCAACAGGSGTSPSTCAATRRPTASGRATSSTTSATASSSSRSASRTASACSARSPTSPTSSRATTTRRPRRGSPGTTRTSASSGRSPSRSSPTATATRRGWPRSPTSCLLSAGRAAARRG